MPVYILNDSCFSHGAMKKAEVKYNAKWIVDSAVPYKNGWSQSPAAIFYTETPHPDGSNYFGLYQSIEGWKIFNAIFVTEKPFNGLLIDDDIIFSRYRHDFREHKGVFVDGGRDNFRCGGERMNEAKKVHIKVMKDQLILDCEIC